MESRDRRREPEEQADESDRLKRLLVMRDGFVAAMLLVFALAILPALFGDKRVDAAAPEIVALFPLAEFILVGVVMSVSRSVRGVNTSQQLMPYRYVFYGLVGALTGVGVLITLLWFELIQPQSNYGIWAGTIGMVVGSLIGITIAVLLSRRR